MIDANILFPVIHDTESESSQKHSREVSFNFSQPISDNVEEAVSGVKGSMAIKIIGQDLNVLDKEATRVYDIMRKVPVLGDYFVKEIPPEDNPF